MNNEDKCSKCPHTYYDHDGWMDEDQRERVRKVRAIGCRVIGCGCEEFTKTRTWEIGIHCRDE